MPTVIVLDVSLSMTRLVPNQASDLQTKHTYHSLAVQGIHQFLDYLSENSRLEHVSIVSTFFRSYLPILTYKTILLFVYMFVYMR